MNVFEDSTGVDWSIPNSKCELGERRIDPLDLYDLAKVYKKPVSWFWPR